MKTSGFHCETKFGLLVFWDTLMCISVNTAAVKVGGHLIVSYQSVSGDTHVSVILFKLVEFRI